MSAPAQGALLGSSSFANGAKSDIASADRQVAWTNEALECRNLWKTDWENFCRVENFVITCSHVSDNHRNAEFISLPHRLISGRSSIEIAPTSAFVFLRWCERVVVAVKIEPSPRPGLWQTCFRCAHRFLHGAFEPFIWISNFIEVRCADAINGVAGGGLTDVLNAQFSEELKSIPIPVKRSQFVDGNRTVEKSFYCQPWPQVACGNILGVRQCLRAFRDGTFSSLGTCLSGFCCFPGIGGDPTFAP